MASLVNVMKHIKESTYQSFSNASKFLKKREIFNLFYEASITWILKSEKDAARKDNYRPISLMKLVTKILTHI